MSQAPSLSTTTDEPDRPDPYELVEENRDLFEKIAASDLEVAEYFERALEAVDDQEEGS